MQSEHAQRARQPVASRMRRCTACSTRAALRLLFPRQIADPDVIVHLGVRYLNRLQVRGAARAWKYWPICTQMSRASASAGGAATPPTSSPHATGR